MYEAFYGFREKPFSILPDPSFLYLSRKHSMALDLLEYGLLAATIAIAGVVVFPDIAMRMGVLFDRWAGDINIAWVPPAPLP